MSGFWTVLGGDYSGKSHALRTLAADGWRIVSYDDPYVRRYPVIRSLRNQLFFDAYRGIDRPYSAYLVFSLLTPIAWFLRDEALRQAAHGPTVVDSYYFKLLAKGVITGITDPETRTLWRSFPQPDGVIYLDVPGPVAWRRAGGPEHLNPFEHYGPEPNRDRFLDFQRDLRDAMRHEIRHLDVVTIDATASRAQVTRELRAVLRPTQRQPVG